MKSTFEVVVIGAGPVGMVAAALLARQGHSVAVVERHASLYGLPRAATFDDETMQTFDVLGIAERLLPLVRYQPTYEWRNAAGDLLLELSYAERGAQGWAEWYQMYQPDIEDALFAACRTAGVEFRFGVEALEYLQTDGGVEVRTSGASLHAQYVVACDGGNGITRGAIGATLTDFGFSEPWLVCDFELRGTRPVPHALQVGDPRQPTSIISLGRRHQRFSFMLDSPEDFERERDPALVWRRVAAYLEPEDAELIRTATYTFRSLLSDKWRENRILLAGDAAHQMPPFLGQGMVSGIRDARNLAFKLDLVLSADASESLLDTYQSERSPHVEAITRRGIDLGRIQTERDPAAAAERDRRLLAQREEGGGPQKVAFPPIGEGLLASEDAPGRGTLMPQGRVAWRGDAVNLDRVLAQRGFVFIVRGPFGMTAPEPSTRLVVVGDGGLDDVDGTYGEWFDRHDAIAALVRPDGYVFGTAARPDQIPMLDEELRAALTPTHTRQLGAGR